MQKAAKVPDEGRCRIVCLDPPVRTEAIFGAMRGSLARWLSYIWPVMIQRLRGAHGDLELTWEYGRLVVNSANANQSFGRLHQVWEAAFRDADVARRRPGTALVLGYGAGSVAHILRDEMELGTAITGVDDDEAMLRIAQEYFPLTKSAPVELVRADALAFVGTATGTYDLIVVDLFQDLDFAAGVESPDLLRAIRRLASPSGLVLVNTIAHDEKSSLRSARLGAELRLLFRQVKEHHYDASNRVFIAL